MSCGIGMIGEQCADCGRLVMAHSICPVSGIPATPPTAEEKAAAEKIAIARATAQGMLAALVNGHWPSGHEVGSVEAVTVQRFDGEYVEGMEPVETVRVKVVNGELIVEEV